jgi:RNA polymerase sigma factor (sigma-70 family)
MAADGPEEFCDAVRGRLVGALTLATGQRAVAEELAQEALVRVWQRWDRVSRLDAPEAWAVRVGLNLATSWHRRRLAEWRANRRTGTAEPATGDDDRAVAVAVQEAVSALPERQRAVIVARYFLGYDVAATAELLGCAEGTVKSSTHQAIARLRTLGLVEDEDEEVPVR